MHGGQGTGRSAAKGTQLTFWLFHAQDRNYNMRSDSSGSTFIFTSRCLVVSKQSVGSFCRARLLNRRHSLFPILPPNMPPYKHVPKGERVEVQSHLILLRSTDTALLQTGGCGRPAPSKPVGTIFPTASAPFMALLPVNLLRSISEFSITTEFVLATRDITVVIVLGLPMLGPLLCWHPR